MSEVEVKLSEWHRLHKELGTVQRELADALLRSAHQQHRELCSRAAVLQAEAEIAFKALCSAIESKKQPGKP